MNNLEKIPIYYMSIDSLMQIYKKKDIVKFDYILNADDTIKNVSDKIIEIKNEQSKKTVHKKPTFK